MDDNGPWQDPRILLVTCFLHNWNTTTVRSLPTSSSFCGGLGSMFRVVEFTWVSLEGKWNRIRRGCWNMWSPSHSGPVWNRVQFDSEDRLYLSFVELVHPSGEDPTSRFRVEWSSDLRTEQYRRQVTWLVRLSNRFSLIYRSLRPDGGSRPTGLPYDIMSKFRNVKKKEIIVEITFY